MPQNFSQWIANIAIFNILKSLKFISAIDLKTSVLKIKLSQVFATPESISIHFSKKEAKFKDFKIIKQ